MNRQVTRPYTYTKVNFIGIHITTDINETSRNGNIGAIFFNFSSDLLSFLSRRAGPVQVALWVKQS